MPTERAELPQHSSKVFKEKKCSTNMFMIKTNDTNPSRPLSVNFHITYVTYVAAF